MMSKIIFINQSLRFTFYEIMEAMTHMQTKIMVDVDQYWRDGYLTAPAVLSEEQLVTLRKEADRVVSVCSAEPERYARRIEWEVDHLAENQRQGMDKVIRKLEPVSDLSPLFAELAHYSEIVNPVSA